jgi:LmbE family N-acetylglucosaminyl deacetylase
MLPLGLKTAGTGPLRVLALGAHSDDVEIGCGATLLQLLRNDDVDVHWVVLGAHGERAEEAYRSADAFLEGAAARTVAVEGFRDAFLPYLGPEVKDYFEDLKQTATPDLVLTHQRNDLHQDHRLVCELTWNTFRDHLIVEYEVPKYDGDLGAPNLFMHVDEESARRKVELLLTLFGSQRDRRWFTEDLFMAMMRLRGMESNSPSRLAEAFYARKLVVAAAPTDRSS